MLLKGKVRPGEHSVTVVCGQELAALEPVLKSLVSPGPRPFPLGGFDLR